MDNFIGGLIVLILVITILTYTDSINSNLIKIKSPIDNKEHLVQNTDDKEKAADLLANVKNNLEKFCSGLQKKYPSDDKIKRLKSNFDTSNIMEAEPNSKYTSYSINKGEKIILCMRSKDEKRELIDENTLMFVALHELAHVITKSIGHTKEFWDNFKFILREAVKSDIYTCEDYAKYPKKYCGIQVNDNPISCSSLY